MSSETGFRAARKAKGLKLIEVAKEAGLSPGMVSMVENGLRPSPKTGARLAAVLDRPASEFWEGM